MQFKQLKLGIQQLFFYFEMQGYESIYTACQFSNLVDVFE